MNRKGALDRTLRSEYHQFKDHQSESRLFKRRLLVSGALVLLLLGVLLFRFYDLQISGYQNYETQSEKNRIHYRPVPANRGLLFDNKGRILAENRAINTLTITTELIDNLDASIEALEKLIPLSEREKKQFYKALKLRRRPYQAVPIKYNLNEEQQAKIAVNQYRLHGVEIQGRLARHYPYAELFSHTVGYVGRINRRELESFTDEDAENYAGTDSIGKIGLEKFYEAQLLGKPGREKIETNARGRIVRTFAEGSKAPSSGANLSLFLDVDVQKAILDAMQGRRGAVVAIDVESGGVLAMLSSPSYDPNAFIGGISERDYRALNQSRDLPLFNRTIQGQYPPGSTLKPILGLAGLEYRMVSAHTKIADPGFYQLENDERIYRDWKIGGHGAHVNLRQAIAESCDVYFYDLGIRLGVDRMHDFGTLFGLGEATNIDIVSERSGLWPSRAWKQRARGLHWFPGNSLNMSIGQGDVLATPLQLAQMTATLARRGEFIEPRIVAKINGEATKKVVRSTYAGEQKNWQAVWASMKDVVHSVRGTANSIAGGIDFQIAGKTGTAQVVGIAQDAEYDSEALSERNRDHALFVGFAPYDAPKIAVAAVIENGEKSSEAGKVVKQAMISYLSGIRGAQ